jgi:hypothetical protein
MKSLWPASSAKYCMLEVTREHGAPTADALIKAIDFARNKARLESARAGEDFLAECQRGDGAGEWWVGEEAS